MLKTHIYSHIVINKNITQFLIVHSIACPQNYSQCTENGRCIPESWRCDHEKDCPDGSDEGVKCGKENSTDPTSHW